jgi:peptidoglycan-associated lipoprotein
MFKLRISCVAAGVICCVLAVFGGLAPHLGAQERNFDDVTAAELLEDGLDALSDQADESGRRLLDRVISDYPGSPEAMRAKRALAALDRGELDPDARARLKADEAERTAEYRRAFLVDVGDRVFFAENSAALGGRARSIIEQQARWLNARPDLSVMVIGRADSEGDQAAVRTLSLQRAQTVRDRLVAAGLQPGRIEIKAAGNQDRVALCAGPLCVAQNRNVEVLINYWHSDARWRSSQQMPDVAKQTTTNQSDALIGSENQISQ